MAHLFGGTIGAQVRTLAAALLLGTAILAFSPGGTAHAARGATTIGDTTPDPGPGGGEIIMVFTKTKAELIAAGYSCSKVATGFSECTKAGADTYWCDGSDTCEVKPFRNQDIINSTTLPRGGGTMTYRP
jgi:hypothetical protein